MVVKEEQLRRLMTINDTLTKIRETTFNKVTEFPARYQQKFTQFLATDQVCNSEMLHEIVEISIDDFDFLKSET